MSWGFELKVKSGEAHDAIAKEVAKQINPDSAATLATILAYFQMVSRDNHNNGNEVILKSNGHVNSDGSGSWDIHVEIPTPVPVKKEA